MGEQRTCLKSLKRKYSCFRKKIDMVVIRVSASENLELVNSKPCNVCLWYMKMIGVRNCYYSDESGGLTRIKIQDTDQTYFTPGHIKYYEFVLGKGDKCADFGWKCHHKKKTNRKPP